MVSRTPRVISVILIFLILLGAIAIVYSISSETRSALKESLQERLMTVAGITATGIDGDAFARLRAGDENTPAFIRIRDQLRQVKNASQDVRFLYTMRKNGDMVEFVVDGDYGYSADAAQIGDIYPQAESDLIAGFSGPSADEDFTTDQWGTVLSGYYPIRDSTGAIVGIVGVDMDSSVVLAILDRINLILYIVGFLAMFSIAGGIVVVENRRTNDERELEESEEKFKTLFESAGSAIFLLDNAVLLDCNHRTESMFGCTREEIIGKTPGDLSPERQPDGQLSAEAAKERMENALRGEAQTFEWVHHRCDGTPFDAEVRLNRIVVHGMPFLQAIVQDITERKKSENALRSVTKKLTLLNSITFNEIRNAVFALNGYLALEREPGDAGTARRYLEKEDELVGRISKSLAFAKSYQNLGVNPPLWQSVNQSFIMGISHLDFSRIERSVRTDQLEIFADPLLERVFFLLSENVLLHAKNATRVTISYRLTDDHLLLFFEDNGVGVAAALKERIFERGFGNRQGMELFMAREILSITGITIRESGTEGNGARFEFGVPKGVFRFPEAGSAGPDGGEC
jgi:PAS domain S-box-containing protein